MSRNNRYRLIEGVLLLLMIAIIVVFPMMAIIFGTFIFIALLTKIILLVTAWADRGRQ